MLSGLLRQRAAVPLIDQSINSPFVFPESGQSGTDFHVVAVCRLENATSRADLDIAQGRGSFVRSEIGGPLPVHTVDPHFSFTFEGMAARCACHGMRVSPIVCKPSCSLSRLLVKELNLSAAEVSVSCEAQSRHLFVLKATLRRFSTHFKEWKPNPSAATKKQFFARSARCLRDATFITTFGRLVRSTFI